MFSFLKPSVEVQLNVPREGLKDIDSEIDWKIIDQLHNAVLNFSRNSMQSKKIMFTLIGVFLTAILQAPTICAIVKWFPILIIVVALFWFFDAQTYYYQEKLRALMDVRFRALKKRCSKMDPFDDFTLPKERERGCRVFRSLWNASTFIYPVIIGVVVLCWVLINKGVLS